MEQSQSKHLTVGELIESAAIIAYDEASEGNGTLVIAELNGVQDHVVSAITLEDGFMVLKARPMDESQ